MKTLMCLIIPPIGVAMKGGSGSSIILNIILTMCGYIPGILHALIVSDRSKQQSNIIINNNITNQK